MSLQISVDFPERSWSAAIVELSQFLDLTDYDTISVDIFLPFKAPKGLRAKMILTVGDNWRFTEMSRSVRLEPGKWNRIEARVAGKTFDWRGVRSGDNFRNDIRKIAVRIESDKRPAYKGHIYIDTLMVYGTNGK
jgi:hypothetical protein